MRLPTALFTATALAFAAPAWASVTSSDPGGFAVEETLQIAAPADRVFAALTRPSGWWSPDHTFSHDAANLTLDPRAGGCWCERLPGGGSVEHLRVIYADAPRMLRLRGALGPMQSMPVEGVMTWTLTPSGAGTELKVTYAVAGDSSANLGARLSAIVDQVLGQQAARLKALVETGRPAP